MPAWRATHLHQPRHRADVAKMQPGVASWRFTNIELIALHREARRRRAVMKSRCGNNHYLDGAQAYRLSRNRLRAFSAGYQSAFVMPARNNKGQIRG